MKDDDDDDDDDDGDWRNCCENVFRWKWTKVVREGTLT